MSAAGCQADRIALKGIAVGNGIVNETVQSGSFVEFAKKSAPMPLPMPLPMLLPRPFPPMPHVLT